MMSQRHTEQTQSEPRRAWRARPQYREEEELEQRLAAREEDELKQRLAALEEDELKQRRAAREKNELKQRLAAREALANHMKAILGDQAVDPPPTLDREFKVVLKEISQIQDQLFFHDKALQEDVCHDKSNSFASYPM